MSGAYVMDSSEMQNLHVHGAIPAEIAEKWKEFFPEHGDLSYEEVLLQQESAYHFIQSNVKNKENTSSSSGTSNRSSALVQQSESSHDASVEAQLAFDEALALSLQEIDEDFENLCVSDQSGHTTENRESTPIVRTPVRVTSHSASQDDIDPDNLTYEELQSLGEAVGHESKGLSEDLISRLPIFVYKIGFFSKKKRKEDCVICCSEYKNGARLITLPCLHQYHAACITRWLKLNKSCPVCQVEVRED